MSIHKMPSPTNTVDLLLREQLAAQAVAVIAAHFSRPDMTEFREIMKCMDSQYLHKEANK